MMTNKMFWKREQLWNDMFVDCMSKATPYVLLLLWYIPHMHLHLTLNKSTGIRKPCTQKKTVIRNTETGMSSFWWNFHHWLHWKLLIWQFPVQSVIKTLSKWHVRLSEERLIITDDMEDCFLENHQRFPDSDTSSLSRVTALLSPVMMKSRSHFGALKYEGRHNEAKTTMLSPWRPLYISVYYIFLQCL